MDSDCNKSPTNSESNFLCSREQFRVQLTSREETGALLLSRLDQMRKDGNLTDLIIQVGTQTFKCHRCMLYSLLLEFPLVGNPEESRYFYLLLKCNLLN